jgi:predicted PurR-regulated permease PerM
MNDIQNLAQFGSNQLGSYYKVIQDNINLQNQSIQDLNAKNSNLQTKEQIQLDQLKEIQEKEKLLLTRSRMLQISQDRNSYKKKIIYSLIALIFAIFIITIVIYVFFIKKMDKVQSGGYRRK